MPKQILVELDSETATLLERVAPARSCNRSDFIRSAIRRALWEVEERETRAAYLRMPDAKDAGWAEPSWGTWTAAAPKRRVKK